MLRLFGLPKTARERVFCVRKAIVDRILDVMVFLQQPTHDSTLAAAAHLNGIGERALAGLARVDDLTAEPRLEPLFDFREQFHRFTVASQVQNIGNMSGKSPEGEYGIFKGSSLNWHSDSVNADVSFLGRALTRYDHIPTYTELVDASAQVMTVHQAKGMEAPIVIVDGYSFFSSRGNQSEASVYEMARVMYVALSRAERELYLVTDGREFPNMHGVYAAIKRQTETSFAGNGCEY